MGLPLHVYIVLQRRNTEWNAGHRRNKMGPPLGLEYLKCHCKAGYLSIYPLWNDFHTQSQKNIFSECPKGNKTFFKLLIFPTNNCSLQTSSPKLLKKMTTAHRQSFPWLWKWIAAFWWITVMLHVFWKIISSCIHSITFKKHLLIFWDTDTASHERGKQSD